MEWISVNDRMLPRKVKRWHVIVKEDGYSSKSESETAACETRGRCAIIEHEWGK